MSSSAERCMSDEHWRWCVVHEPKIETNVKLAKKTAAMVQPRQLRWAMRANRSCRWPPSRSIFLRPHHMPVRPVHATKFKTLYGLPNPSHAHLFLCSVFPEVVILPTASNLRLPSAKSTVLAALDRSHSSKLGRVSIAAATLWQMRCLVRPLLFGAGLRLTRLSAPVLLLLPLLLLLGPAGLLPR